RELHRVVPWRDDPDDADRLRQDLHAGREEHPARLAVLGLHPIAKVRTRVLDSAQHQEQLRHQALVARSISEIARYGIGNGVLACDERFFQLLERRESSVMARRTGSSLSLLHPNEESAQVVGRGGDGTYMSRCGGHRLERI